MVRCGLAFAVQVLLDKDILIVDEALAVGDEVFQHQCFTHIERFREEGYRAVCIPFR